MDGFIAFWTGIVIRSVIQLSTLEKIHVFRFCATFLMLILHLQKQHIIGVSSRLLYNIDETARSDWEE
jgi:hypothetical protein